MHTNVRNVFLKLLNAGNVFLKQCTDKPDVSGSLSGRKSLTSILKTCFSESRKGRSKRI